MAIHFALDIFGSISLLWKHHIFTLEHLLSNPTVLVKILKNPSDFLSF